MNVFSLSMHVHKYILLWICICRISCLSKMLSYICCAYKWRDVELLISFLTTLSAIVIYSWCVLIHWRIQPKNPSNLIQSVKKKNNKKCEQWEVKKGRTGKKESFFFLFCLIPSLLQPCISFPTYMLIPSPEVHLTTVRCTSVLLRWQPTLLLKLNVPLLLSELPVCMCFIDSSTDGDACSAKMYFIDNQGSFSTKRQQISKQISKTINR